MASHSDRVVVYRKRCFLVLSLRPIEECEQHRLSAADVSARDDDKMSI